jgi:hypothetical protein
LSFAGSQNPFKQEIENTQLILISFIDKYAVNIVIPDGYTVEQVPEPLNVSIENGLNFKCLLVFQEILFNYGN